MKKFMKLPSVRFRLRKETGLSTAVLYCHIRYAGIEAPKFSTGIEATLTYDTSNQRFAGQGDRANELNGQLNDIRTAIKALYEGMIMAGDIITAAELKARYLRKEATKTVSYNFLRCYTNYVADFPFRKGLEPKTIQKWKNSVGFLREYLDYTNALEMDIREIKMRWIKKYWQWLRCDKEFGVEHSLRHIQYLTGAFRYWQEEEWIECNPLATWKTPESIKRQRIFKLRESEVLAMYAQADNLAFTHAESNAVRLFVLMCYTGWEYCDLADFDRNKHIRKIGNNECILKVRTKNDDKVYAKESAIYIFPIVKEILEHFDYQLPKYTNQFINRTIKLAARFIKHPTPDKITCRTGRKTIATILYNHGMELQYIKEFLGHMSIVTTERFYADMEADTVVKMTSKLVDVGRGRIAS